MTVTLTPNPATPGSTVAVEGTGFTPKTKIRIKDAGDVWRSRADGGFSVGLVVSTTPRTQAVVVQQQVSGAWVTAWSGTVVVQAAAPPPPPPPPPPPTSEVTIPPSIDSATGDVTAALQTFLDSVPAGKTIAFTAGETYQVNGGLLARSGQTWTTHGAATIKMAGSAQSIIRAYSVDGWKLLGNLTILGDNADAGGPNAYHGGGQEYAHGLSIRGSRNIEVGAGVKVSRTWGDDVFIGSRVSYADWCDNVHLHDAVFELNGRCSVVVNAGRNITVERCTLDQTAMHAIDLEPDDPAQGAANVKFLNNTIGPYGLSSIWAAFLLAVVGVPGAVVDGLVFEGNTVAGNTSGYQSKQLGLDTFVIGGTVRRKNVTVRNNVCNRPAGNSYKGSVLFFENVDGVVATGNVQPLVSGATLLKTVGCTGVVTA